MKHYALALLIVLLSLSNQVYASSWLDLDIFERDDGNYFTLQTKDGK